ncbi:uncharacterized protein LOC142776470 [Rhipicephalus microplus]|uniref:uncharacterized protein LOC142776470 n=1 Tax=Rhipicephalus microplus TaxID=6941 RepID=UPI003F6D926C
MASLPPAVWWLDGEVSASAHRRASENSCGCGGAAVAFKMPLFPPAPSAHSRRTVSLSPHLPQNRYERNMSEQCFRLGLSTSTLWKGKSRVKGQLEKRKKGTRTPASCVRLGLAEVTDNQSQPSTSRISMPGVSD